MDSAEQAALSGAARGEASYLDARRLNVFAQDGRLAEGSKRLQLSPSRHFDHLSVNTTKSAILMPPFVDEFGEFCLHENLFLCICGLNFKVKIYYIDYTMQIQQLNLFIRTHKEFGIYLIK